MPTAWPVSYLFVVCLFSQALPSSSLESSSSPDPPTLLQQSCTLMAHSISSLHTVLWHYDPDRKLHMETDVSGTACAGILSQKWKDGWHPIAYFSRKFSGPELNYPIYDKELLAIVLGFRQWRHYLEGASKIEVWSDHQNLKQFMSQMMLNGHQARWLLQLAP